MIPDSDRNSFEMIHLNHIEFCGYDLVNWLSHRLQTVQHWLLHPKQPGLVEDVIQNNCHDGELSAKVS